MEAEIYLGILALGLAVGFGLSWFSARRSTWLCIIAAACVIAFAAGAQLADEAIAEAATITRPL